MTEWKGFTRKKEASPNKEISPYIHWWVNNDRTPSLIIKERGQDFFNKRGIEFLRTSPALASTFQVTGIQEDGPSLPIDGNDEFVPQHRIDPDLNTSTGFVGDHGLPFHAKNPNFNEGDWKRSDLADQIPKIPRDTVIVGIIDDGIALGNARFWRPLGDGKIGTRFLGAWIQGGAHDGKPQPFGRELTENDIVAAMQTNTHNGWLDEEALNRSLDAAPDGEALSYSARRLMGAMVHGTHVLDLAMGEDFKVADDEELQRRRIIAVNLPSREAIGMSGTFLEFYASKAMEWIVELADALWNKHHGDKDPKGGFPVVINLSYGQQGGMKTGNTRIEQTFKNLQKKRKDGAPIRLVMPIGNDNLTRSNARWRQKQDAPPLEVPWRVQPQDQSSNFVEIWGELKAGELKALDGKLPLEIRLLKPAGTAGIWLPGQAAPGEINPGATFGNWLSLGHTHFFDHYEGYLRIYADVIDLSDQPKSAEFGDQKQTLNQAIRYVIAMRPTLDHQQPDRVALAGGWKIQLRWSEHADFSNEEDSMKGREIYVNVQVDQEPSPMSNINRRSYFDDENYRTHLPSGRLIDSYSYSDDEHNMAGRGINLEPANVFGPVQRKGTQNSLAGYEDILLIAGHRQSDGRPADFSATMFPGKRGLGQGIAKSIPDASFPVDASPSQTGVRATGSKSGSSGTMRGTSFAAPQATRWVVDQLRKAQQGDGTDIRNVATYEHLKSEAECVDSNNFPAGKHPVVSPDDKIGKGRMPARPGILKR